MNFAELNPEWHHGRRVVLRTNLTNPKLDRRAKDDMRRIEWNEGDTFRLEFNDQLWTLSAVRMKAAYSTPYGFVVLSDKECARPDSEKLRLTALMLFNHCDLVPASVKDVLLSEGVSADQIIEWQYRNDTNKLRALCRTVRRERAEERAKEKAGK